MSRYKAKIMEIEKPIIEKALELNGNSAIRTSFYLMINSKTLTRRMSAYGIKPKAFDRSSVEEYSARGLFSQTKEQIKAFLKEAFEMHDMEIKATAIYLGICEKTLDAKLNYFDLKVQDRGTVVFQGIEIPAPMSIDEVRKRNRVFYPVDFGSLYSSCSTRIVRDELKPWHLFYRTRAEAIRVSKILYAEK